MKLLRMDQLAALTYWFSVSSSQANAPIGSTSAWTAQAVRSSAVGVPGQPVISANWKPW